MPSNCVTDIQRKHAAKLTRIDQRHRETASELPGMWEPSDLSGGATDAEDAR